MSSVPEDRPDDAPTPSEAAEPTSVDGPLGPHDPGGLDLARSVARSVGRRSGRPGRRRRSTRPPTDPQVSGTHPDDRDPQLLGAALDSLVEAKGWSTEVTLHSLLGRWAALVGPVNAEHSRPESYRDQVLVVRADSSVWASSLRAVAPQLRAILNDRLGEGAVERISVVGPQAPSWKRGPRSVRDGRGPRDTYG